MAKPFTSLKKVFFPLLFISSFLGAQTPFWTESFSNGCASNCSAVGYSGINGAWTQTITGPEDPAPNRWFVSSAENNNGIGVCTSAATGNPTLHISADPSSILCPSDCGAAYDAGGGFPTNTTTDRRIESPTINCSAQSGAITLAFTYIEEGDPGSDYFEVYYSANNGGSWTLLGTPTPTNNSSCAAGGTMTPYSVALPASASSNATVKIGFRWRNDDDGIGFDPSCAIDDVTLASAAVSAIPVVTIGGPTTGCVGTPLAFTGSATNAPILSWTWSALPAGATISTPSSQNPSITFSSGGTYTLTLNATNASGSGTQTYTVVISATGPPTIAISPTTACAGQSNTFTAAITNGGTAPTYQWQVNGGNVGTGNSYTSASLTAGQTVTCILTSNSACASPTTATSNSVTVTSCGNPTPSITLSSTTACAGTPIGFGGSVSGGVASSWAWTSNPAANATFTTPTLQNTSGTFSAGGTYTITLTVQPGGGTATATVTITALPTLAITATKDTICKGTSTTLTAATATAYQWSSPIPGSQAAMPTVTVSPTVSTTYTVVGTTNNCSSVATKNIIVLNNTAAQAGATNYFPCMGSISTLTANPSGMQYSWAPSINLSCYNCQNPTFTPTVAGPVIYTLTVTGKCLTTTTDTVMVTGVQCVPPTPVIMQYNHDICRLDCVQFFDSSYYPPLTYLWVFEGGSPDTSYVQNPVVCYNIESSQAPGGTGYYYIDLTVKNVIGQSNTIRDSIRVLPSPLASINNGQHVVNIQTGDAVTLDASSWTGGATSYTWTQQSGVPVPSADLSCTNCGITSASPLFTTTYIVQATNSIGCSDYDTIQVRVDLKCGEVFVPNAFSPNNDGVNDVLHVRTNCFNQMLFKIYNRWGEVVFQSEDPTIGWDGTYNGKPMDTGVFVYYIEGNLKDKERTLISQKGNITLVR
ncbi:MAG: gliding motility-associated C-terminal domain-containing protein [Bacteroidia bacterium]